MATAVALRSDSAAGHASLPRLEEAQNLFEEYLPCEDLLQLRRAYLRLALLYHPDKQPEEDRVAATQLFQAIAAAYEKLLRALEPDSGQQNRRVMSPVFAAAELGDLVELRRLIEERPDCVWEEDDVGVCPLMFAAAGGFVEAAELLLDKGADLHAVNPINWSVVLYAALGNHAPMVRFLVSRGGEVTGHDLILAAFTGNPASLEVLLEFYKGSVSNLCTNESRKTLLHLACEGMCFLRHSAEQHAQCVELLLKYKVPINAQEPFGKQTCLQLYVADVRWRTQHFENSSSHMQVLERLCEEGASVTVEDAEGRSALSISIENSLPRVREILFGYA